MTAKHHMLVCWLRYNECNKILDKLEEILRNTPKPSIACNWAFAMEVEKDGEKTIVCVV